MNMPDFYFEQLVTEAFLDLVFDWTEQADLAIRQDVLNPLDGSGDPRGAIHRGGEITPTASPSMSVKATSMVATDPDGRRVYWGEEQTIDCTLDYLGVSTTADLTSGEERYLGLFAEFDRELTEERIDGNGVSVYTQQLESFEIKVYAGAKAGTGSALPPATPAGKVRLANVKIVYNQTQILTADIEYDTASYLRDDWVRLTGTELGDFVFGNPYKAIEQLFDWLDDVAGGGATFSSTSNWHDGSALVSTAMSAAINEIVSDLANSAGSDRVGAAAHTTANNYCDLADGSVQDQMRTVADNVDGHINGDAPAHADTAVTAGSKAGSPNSLATGSVGSQLTSLISYVNARARKASTETISSTWTHTANLVMNSILRLGDGPDYYIRGDGDTSGKYYTLFRRGSSGFSRLLYSGGYTGSIIWAYNLYWDHTNDVWKADNLTTDSWALRISSSGMYFQRMDNDDPLHSSSGWTDSQWSSSLRYGAPSGTYGMAVYPQVFNVAGNEVYDRVRAALCAKNMGASAGTMNNLTAITWHAQLTGIVSGDITVTEDGEQQWSSLPTVSEIDQYGCMISGTSDSLVANGGLGTWRGTVEVELTI